MTDNSKLIEKAITIAGGALNDGGRLNTKQQAEFLKLVRSFPGLLPLVRFKPMDREREDIDKMHIGEPITKGATEATVHTAGNEVSPKHNKVNLTVSKLRSDWAYSTEILEENLERDGYEDSLRSMILQRIATDIELVSIQGDTTITGIDPINALLQQFNGWDILSNSAHIVDVGGDTISKAVWTTMLKRMPKNFLQDPGLRWLVGRDIAADWMNAVADRATPLGDQSINGGFGAGGAVNAPYGIPLKMVPLIPDNKVVTGVSSATPAYIQSSKFGPYAFDSSLSNNVLRLSIDNVTPGFNTTFVSSGTATLDVSEVAAKINAAAVAASGYGAAYKNIARMSGEGRLLIVSPTTGTSSQIELQYTNGGNLACAVLLGLGTNAVVSSGTVSSSGGEDTINGLAAGSGQNINGSLIWLVNPMNFVLGMLNGTRLYGQYNQDKDQTELVVYNQVAVAIENVDALVKAIGVVSA